MTEHQHAEAGPGTDAHQPAHEDVQPVDPRAAAGVAATGTVETDGWERLSSRVIWVDAVQVVLSILPVAVAVGVFGVEIGGVLWPVVGLAGFGVIGALSDVWRWAFTRYRITPTHVERRTGLLVKAHRSVQRDRIRSVDATATLRHRLAGLRVIEVGAGQQHAAGESALSLDAVSVPASEALRRELVTRRRDVSSNGADGVDPVTDATPRGAGEPDADDHGDPDAAADVLAGFEPRWVLFNMFSIWAFLMAAGIGWGGQWFLSMVGIDVVSPIVGWFVSAELGLAWTIVVAVIAAGALGAAGLAIAFVTQHWRFELARVRNADGADLRTRQGLFTTREVNRDDGRVRGVSIGEPVVWRWMGMADTTLMTTGLNMWSMTPAAAIVPRGPIAVARRVAADILGGGTSPLEVDLPRHPGGALRRRLWWAGAGTAVLVAVAGIATAAASLPGWVPVAVAAVLPVAMLGAVVAYRALGHAVVGPYVVTRSGLMSRTTAALQRDAVSTIAIRESLLQRRLGLATVSCMTAAGWGIYEAPDVAADEAVAFAAAAAPGLMEPYLEPVGDRAP